MNCCKNMPSNLTEADLAALKAEQGVYTLLGFAQKAGKLTGGGEAVALALAKGQVQMVLLAADLSENSQKRFAKMWQQLPKGVSGKVVIWQFGSKEKLGQAAGKPPRGIWAVGDENFARGLQSKLMLLQEQGRAEQPEL
ncbi:MAG: ribosomal L7Ae/L30e/S12e/Gadd45 family protein [Firmicutes bacterium]|nr:ribosomal L7Ae/L30e/S12e/Gadd45 family protein [Bacillota bacterium]